ncbi:MAG: Lipid A core - O-antigen ligase [Rhodospirillaceae bacterium]|nr:MAG: Lipid A core - O-antigen ligase [Rhodospirillaceae bacterium]
MKWGKIVLQRGHILAGAAFVMLPLAVFASKAMTPLAIGTAVLLLGREVWASRRFPPLPPLGGIVGLLAGGVAWGAISVAWTVDMGNTVGKTGQLLGLFSAGLVLIDAARRLEPKEKTWVKRALLAGFLLGSLVLACESLTDGLLSRWVRGLPAEAGLLFKAPATVAALMVFPVVAALAGRWAWGVTGLLAILLLPTHGTTAVAAVGIGGVVLLAARVRFRVTALVVAGWIVTSVVVAPVAPFVLSSCLHRPTCQTLLPSMVQHRLRIWQFTAERIAEKPVLGWGLDASRDMPGGREEVTLAPGTKSRGALLPLHPHNGVLQWWLELGGVGAMLGAGFLIAMIRNMPVYFARYDDAAALALMVAAIVIGLASYGVFQSWWLGTEWLVVTWMLAVGRRPENTESRSVQCIRY